MTLSTHGSIFTGLYAARHGAHLSEKHPAGRRLAESHLTLTEILASQGYSTSAVVANIAILTPLHGLIQGFARCDHRVALPFLGFLSEAQAYTMRAQVRDLLTVFSTPKEYGQFSRRAGEINEAVYEEVDRMALLNRPFFLFINYLDAHAPYIPPVPYDRLFPGLNEAVSLDFYSAILRGYNVTEVELQHVRSQYDGAIAYMDAEIGRLLSKLRALGLYEDSLIVITSDHGEALGERKLFGHGVSLYQDQVSVPLLIKYPRGWRERKLSATLSAETRSEPVSSVDLMPTILEVTGLPIPKNLDGTSLLALSRGETRPVFSESYAGNLEQGRRPDDRWRSVVVGRWKLINSRTNSCELFDLQSDPGETRNVCDTKETVRKELLSNLKALTQRVMSDNSVVRPDAQTMETLRSLGYVQ
jgi:arylsulfatase A-like enzyme